MQIKYLIVICFFTPFLFLFTHAKQLGTNTHTQRNTQKHTETHTHKASITMRRWKEESGGAIASV